MLSSVCVLTICFWALSKLPLPFRGCFKASISARQSSLTPETTPWTEPSSAEWISLDLPGGLWKGRGWWAWRTLIETPGNLVVTMCATTTASPSPTTQLFALRLNFVTRPSLLVTVHVSKQKDCECKNRLKQGENCTVLLSMTEQERNGSFLSLLFKIVVDAVFTFLLQRRTLFQCGGLLHCRVKVPWRFLNF